MFLKDGKFHLSFISLLASPVYVNHLTDSDISDMTLAPLVVTLIDPMIRSLPRGCSSATKLIHDEHRGFEIKSWFMNPFDTPTESRVHQTLNTPEDQPIPRQTSIRTQQPESSDLTCGQTCLIATTSCLCHENMRGLWVCLILMLLILALVAISFGIATAIFVGGGESWHDYIANGDVIMTLIIAIFIVCGIAVGYYMVRGLINCCRGIKTSVNQDLERARQSRS
jgi:hypothetical protein